MYSLRDLIDAPAPDPAKGFVIVSAADPRRTPWMSDGWVFLEVESADSFLDQYEADFASKHEDDWQRKTMRELDEIGVISGPVETIVFFNRDRDWPTGTRAAFDRTRKRRRGPKRTHPPR